MKWNRIFLAFAAVFLIIIASFTASPAASQEGTTGEGTNVDTPHYTGCGGAIVPAMNPEYEQQVVDLVNQIRAENGLPPLLRSIALEEAARYHAIDMAQDNYFDHDTYDPGNPDPVCQWNERVSDYYSAYSYLGENIALGYQTPAEVMKGWMASSGHRDNILSRDIREIGVGYAVQPATSSPYWVQDFGARVSIPDFWVYLPQIRR